MSISPQLNAALVRAGLPLISEVIGTTFIFTPTEGNQTIGRINAIEVFESGDLEIVTDAFPLRIREIWRTLRWNCAACEWALFVTVHQHNYPLVPDFNAGKMIKGTLQII